MITKMCNRKILQNKPMTRGRMELSISDSEVAIEEMEGSIANLTEENEALDAGMKALEV